MNGKILTILVSKSKPSIYLLLSNKILAGCKEITN